MRSALLSIKSEKLQKDKILLKNFAQRTRNHWKKYDKNSIKDTRNVYVRMARLRGLIIVPGDRRSLFLVEDPYDSNCLYHALSIATTGCNSLFKGSEEQPTGT